MGWAENAGPTSRLDGAPRGHQFQKLLSQIEDGSGGGGEPTTVKAAEAVSEHGLGHRLTDREKPYAGAAVHYGFGAALGAAYGAAAEIEPRVTAGFGLPYGAAVALIFDEALVPALGLSGPPWRSPASTHAYSLASHLAFGAALEAARRAVRSVV